MKISQKMFIFSFILIIITMNIIGYIMIKTNHETNVKKEISESKKYNEIIVNSLLEYYRSPQSNSEYNNINLIKSLSNILINNDLCVEIYKNSNLLYSNMLYDTIKLEAPINKMGSSIKDVNGESFLFTTLKVLLNDNEFTIYTVRNINEIFDIREKQISFFMTVSISLTFILALILTIIIYFITRKISKLEKNVIKITNGDYSVDFDTTGKDEITSLNNCFKVMIDSINNNINQIKQISENRQTFINDITHELRTPLTSIIGFSELLTNANISDQKIIQKYASKIYQEGKYIENLTENLIQIVLLENKNINLEKKNLSCLLYDIVDSIKNTINNITIHTDIQPNITKNIEETLIKSLVINLVKNASKSYETVGTVNIILTNENLKIVDFGKGIPKNELSNIFEPFYTLDKSRTRNSSSMGLGLPLCKRIVEIHGFKFYINSVLGNGTTVTIKFKEETQNSNEEKLK